MSDGKKKLSFLTVISTIICVVFVCEAAAPAAAIGNQQFFWWIFLILTFLLPYGMVVAELGTTYDGEGGIYDWVRDGLGDKWGARISYSYWVNYPLWIASLATMFPDILGMVFGVEFNLIAKMGIELAFVWIVYLMGRSKAADSELVLNGGAIIKVAVAVIVGAFLITLFANMAAWSFGVNSVARYAAEHGNMPKVFASMISNDDMPNGANLVNAVVASLVLCLQLVPIEAISNGVFWMLFGTSVVFLLLTYIPMFPAFLNLRKNDPDRERIFTFPFKGAMMKVMLAIPCIELVLAIVATLIPFSAAEIGDKVPMIVIFIVLVLIGEVVRVVSARDRETEYKGLTPELAAQRLAEEAAEAEED